MENKPYILPLPQSCTFNTGEAFYLAQCPGIILLSSPCPKELFDHGRLLQGAIREMTGLSLPVMPQKTCASLSGAITLNIDPSMEEDHYQLMISNIQVNITGAGCHEVLWGIQTLRQIISQKGAVLSGVMIHDYPALKHRGFYHDTTRGRIPDLKALKKLADRCSYYKINELQLYVEHSYLFKDYSEVWRDETPLTAQEIMEFDLYCKNLGIDLIPSVSNFSHLYKMLGTKTFSSFCELDDAAGQPFSFANRMAHHTLDISNPDSLQLMKDRIDEFMSLFSSKYFNICADETFDLGLGKTKSLVEKLGKEEVYIRFVSELCHHVVSRGKIPMFWGDIIAAAPEKTSILPKETICLNWGYAPDQSDDTVRAFAKAGVCQYLCPGVQGWHSLINGMPYAYENISRMCRYAHQYGAQGVLNTDWGDMGHINHPDFSAFGLICGAAFSWNSQIPSFDDMCRRVSVLEYGDASETVMDCISQISVLALMNWTTAILFKEGTQGILQVGNLDQYFSGAVGGVMANMSTDTYRTTNQRLDQQLKQLSSYLIRVPASAKYPLTCFIHAGRGQMLLNTIAFHLWTHQYKDTASAPETGTNTSVPAPKEIAADLETWFMTYKDIWRRQGKEADLYRLQDVINWYGDYLRDMEK